MRRATLPHVIRAGDPPDSFPPVSRALAEPNGLLAVGGELTTERLLTAYRRGIFPWYGADQPILWWSPDPRAVLVPAEVRVSRSLRKVLRRGRYRLSADIAFEAVVRGCAAPRAGQSGTWITAGMLRAYISLHRLGFAHSLETWLDGELVGGLYGVALGAAFFGESMFSAQADASKVALVALTRMGFGLIDCQVPSPHLTSMGAVELPRPEFLGLLDALCDLPTPPFVVPAGLP
jgi:leucyl/phenylalanyl-tRNA--protein transferase